MRETCILRGKMEHVGAETKFKSSLRIYDEVKLSGCKEVERAGKKKTKTDRI